MVSPTYSPLRRKPRRHGALALSPLPVMAALFVVLGLLCGGISQAPVLIVFVLTACYSLFTLRGLPLETRLDCFARGAGSPSLLLMVWIFILAGAFAATAKATGAADAAVCLTLAVLPPKMLLAGIFTASCIVSFSVGTSIGTIVAIVPVAAGLAAPSGIPVATLTAAAVGGAFFGDNLSFISDTTIVATRTQGCLLSDKFRANVRIVLPAAIFTLAIYLFMGRGPAVLTDIPDIEATMFVKVIPYLLVVMLAMAGMNVLAVLLLANVATGLIGLLTGAFDGATWMSEATQGIGDMGELIIVSMLAGGILETVRLSGGITYLIHRLTRRVRTTRGAELTIAALVSLTNLCTANNTVAILSVGRISNDIAERYGVDKRRSASILDTFSCAVQGLIPYGAQLLMAAGLAGLNPVEIIPTLYYPMLTAAVALTAIVLRLPRKYSR
ncbi:MAG: Na+/H+ antiporter NhaC family protein [Bacteroidaceae bacterium]|nr:Na+/H+ antiporter NhaC family protein [Bacteroidaceae bacterium]